MLKQITVEPQMISAYMQDRRQIPLTVMSFDVGVHELVVPIVGLDTALITNVLAVFKLLRVDSVIQTDGSVVDDKVHVVIPHQLNGYKGRFTIEIDLQLTNNRSLTLAQFDASARLSDIDDVSDGLQPFYFELFEDLANQVKDKSQQAVTEITNEANNTILDINAQATSVSNAKTQAVNAITSDKQAVDNLKTQALQSIAEDSQSVLNSKLSALQLIGNQTEIVDEAKVSALQSITDDADSVHDSHTQALQSIADGKQTVSDSKTSAMQSINTDAQAVSELATVKQAEIESATASIGESVAEFDGLVADKTDLVNQQYGEFDGNVTNKTSDINQKYDEFNAGLPKIMLYNPALTPVFDTCYRTSFGPAIKLTSGQNWQPLIYNQDEPVIKYGAEGLNINGKASNDIAAISGFLVDGFTTTYPSINIIFAQTATLHWQRLVYVKFVNHDNWIGVGRSGNGLGLYVLVKLNGIVTQVATLKELGASSYPSGQVAGVKIDLKIRLYPVHPNLTPSAVVLDIRFNNYENIVYKIKVDEWAVFGVPTKIGFGSRADTIIYKLEAGSTI